MIVNGSALMRAAPIKYMVGAKIREHGLSYGLSEVGYDFRIKQEVIFTAPKEDGITNVMTKMWNHGTSYKMSHEDRVEVYGSVKVFEPDGEIREYIGRTAIGSSIEEFDIPHNLWAEFRNKSTHARKFLDASLGTDGEPGWRGHLTIEMVFQGPDDYRLPAGCPILKAVFHELTEHAHYTGKYQDQPDKPVDAIFERTI